MYTVESVIDLRAMGARIREKRRALRMTQAQLAKRAGVSTAFVGQLERGEKPPSLDTAARLSLALCDSLDQLVLGYTSRDDTLYLKIISVMQRHGIHFE